MSHVYRFYGGLDVDGGEVIRLVGDEAHHALHVVRVKVEDSIGVFDGRGNAWVCVVESCTRREVVCRVVERSFTEQESPRVIVSMGWVNKDKRVESLVQRCTELGVAEFRFFRGAHSVRDVKVSPKWERWAVESCKQCGRVWVPSITDAVYGSLADVIRDDELTITGLLDKETEVLRDVVSGDRDINLVIGPEGDFSEAEMQTLIDAGARAVSLGDVVYRTEVAGALLAGLVMYELGRVG
jgi:16S rRNA (uracil1498-N3)-methyltransferase